MEMAAGIYSGMLGEDFRSIVLIILSLHGYRL